MVMLFNYVVVVLRGLLHQCFVMVMKFTRGRLVDNMVCFFYYYWSFYLDHVSYPEFLNDLMVSNSVKELRILKLRSVN